MYFATLFSVFGNVVNTPVFHVWYIISHKLSQISMIEFYCHKFSYSVILES